MKEKNSYKTGRGHSLLKVTELAVLSLIMLVSLVSAAPLENITFVTTGSSFSPIITVIGNPTIEWVFGDGSKSNSASPNVNFGSEGTRTNTLVVTPWSAVTKINIGYDGTDGGVTPDPSTIAYLKQQNVIAVSGLENVAPYLQVWASSYNPITELDFSDFTALQTIECLYCTSLDTIKLHNVPALSRLCLERSNISYLDLSEAPVLADFRGARQGSSTYTINWGTTGANIWHICTRDNPHLTSTFPYSQFPLLRELLIWNDNQSGTLHVTSTNLKNVYSSDNHYTTAVFSGCFPAGRQGVVEIQNNDLTSLDISNDPGLLYLNASHNSFNQDAVDRILQTLDSFNTNSGYLDLTGNAAPSVTGAAYANNLITRNWEVKISSGNNPPVANFISDVTFGTAPLEVQFSDTSINNPTTWLWDFGDGTYSTEKSPKHIYSSPGNYTVTLRVSNADGSDFEVLVIAVLEQTDLPEANFRSNVTEGYVPLDVQFTDLSKNATGWYWDFGDGASSTEQNPTYNYLGAGNYTVNLTASNANGKNSKLANITVLTQPKLPVANFSANKTSGYVPLSVQFKDSSTNATSWSWSFGDGTNSTEKDPAHIYSVAGNYSVKLTVSNAFGIASKSSTIYALEGSGSSGESSNGGSSHSSGGGGGSLGSPELNDNIESKEISNAFVARGKYVEFDFPLNATPVVYIAFGAKNTPGKTTTIVEMLNKKSILVSELPSDEVYKSLNIWVGYNGFITPKNIENAVVCFKVEKSWIKDKNITQSSITLNRYTDGKWDQLLTSLSEEDDKYLFFIAQTPGFSPFTITGKSAVTGTEISLANGSNTLLETETNNGIIGKNGSTAANVEPALMKEESLNSSGKENTEMPGFGTVFGAVILNILLLACLLYFFMK